jgi:4-hydroxy-2-oxoheptanedioate aldolase
LPGVDAVFLGPSDLSLSLGHPGDLEHPDVAAAIEQVASAVTGTTGAALFAVVGDEDEARAWRSRGAQLLVFVAPSVIAKRLGSLIQAVNGTAQTGLVSSSTPTTELQS